MSPPTTRARAPETGPGTEGSAPPPGGAPSRLQDSSPGTPAPLPETARKSARARGPIRIHAEHRAARARAAQRGRIAGSDRASAQRASRSDCTRELNSLGAACYALRRLFRSPLSPRDPVPADTKSLEANVERTSQPRLGCRNRWRSDHAHGGAPRMRSHPRPLVASILFLTSLSTPAFAAPPRADLDQARNGGAGSPNNPVQFVNGDANAVNSHYIEGQSIPYRLVLTNLALGAHNVKIEWDIRD